MALDAYVYCDCYETNSLRCNPPRGLKIKVAPNGDLTCDARDQESWSAFNSWKRNKACFHRGMVIAQHRLGKAAVIDLLRNELQKEAKQYPILLSHVLYSGTHTCDWIDPRKIPFLSDEVISLAPERAHTAVADALRVFKIQLAELIIAAQHTRKAICF